MNRISRPSSRSLRSVRAFAASAMESFGDTFDLWEETALAPDRLQGVEAPAALPEIASDFIPFGDRDRTEFERLLGADRIHYEETLARTHEVFPVGLEAVDALSNDPEYRRLAILIGRAPDPYAFCTTRLMELAIAA